MALLEDDRPEAIEKGEQRDRAPRNLFLSPANIRMGETPVACASPIGGVKGSGGIVPAVRRGVAWRPPAVDTSAVRREDRGEAEGTGPRSMAAKRTTARRRAGQRTLAVAKKTFKRTPGNQTANTPRRSTGKRGEARQRTLQVARAEFKRMRGNQTPNTPGARESARRKEAA